MKLKAYEKHVKTAVKSRQFNQDYFEYLRLRDNYPILLSPEVDKVREMFEELGDFELIREENDFFRFNYNPGTVLADLSDWQQEDEFSCENRELTGCVLEARIRMHRDYKTRVMLHTEQGQGPENHPASFNPGKRMNVPEEVAVGGAILSIIEMIKKHRISSCFPRGFYAYPREESFDEIIWHEPKKRQGASA
jgi:hypothetical protein